MKHHLHSKLTKTLHTNVPKKSVSSTSFGVPTSTTN